MLPSSRDFMCYLKEWSDGVEGLKRNMVAGMHSGGPFMSDKRWLPGVAS